MIPFVSQVSSCGVKSGVPFQFERKKLRIYCTEQNISPRDSFAWFPSVCGQNIPITSFTIGDCDNNKNDGSHEYQRTNSMKDCNDARTSSSSPPPSAFHNSTQMRRRRRSKVNGTGSKERRNSRRDSNSSVLSFLCQQSLFEGSDSLFSCGTSLFSPQVGTPDNVDQWIEEPKQQGSSDMDILEIRQANEEDEATKTATCSDSKLNPHIDSRDTLSVQSQIIRKETKSPTTSFTVPPPSDATTTTTATTTTDSTPTSNLSAIPTMVAQRKDDNIFQQDHVMGDGTEQQQQQHQQPQQRQDPYNYGNGGIQAEKTRIIIKQNNQCSPLVFTDFPPKTDKASVFVPQTASHPQENTAHHPHSHGHYHHNLEHHYSSSGASNNNIGHTLGRFGVQYLENMLQHNNKNNPGLGKEFGSKTYMTTTNTNTNINTNTNTNTNTVITISDDHKVLSSNNNNNNNNSNNNKDNSSKINNINKNNNNNSNSNSNKKKSLDSNSCHLPVSNTSITRQHPSFLRDSIQGERTYSPFSRMDTVGSPSFSSSGSDTGVDHVIIGDVQSNKHQITTVGQKKGRRRRRGVACSNCKTIDAPLWRKGLNNDLLCNKCGLYWKRKGFYRPISFKDENEHITEDELPPSRESLTKSHIPRIFTASPSRAKNYNSSAGNTNFSLTTSSSSDQDIPTSSSFKLDTSSLPSISPSSSSQQLTSSSSSSLLSSSTSTSISSSTLTTTTTTNSPPFPTACSSLKLQPPQHPKSEDQHHHHHHHHHYHHQDHTIQAKNFEHQHDVGQIHKPSLPKKRGRTSDIERKYNDPAFIASLLRQNAESNNYPSKLQVHSNAEAESTERKKQRSS